MKEKRGITLIALVVTIVVLLILAGVSISMLAGENGIIKQAQEAKEETIKAKERETISLAKSAIISRGEKVEQENLQKEIDLIEGQGKVNVILSDGLTSLEIYFTETKNTYTEEIYVAQEEEISDEEASYWTYEENEDGTITLLTYAPPAEKLSEITELIVPNNLFGKKVKKIGKGNYYTTIWTNGEETWMGSARITKNSTIKSVWMQEGIEIVDETAFAYGENIEQIRIPGSITSIGSKAFWGCGELTSIIIPDSVTSIGASAFYQCSGLTSVTIPDSVKSIGSRAFCGCVGLTSITIPDSVTSIGEESFYGCSSLTSAIIPDSVTSIGWGTFGECSRLTSVTIPSSVTSIGAYAFHGCSGLTSITIPSSVTSIGEGTFDGCSVLTTVNYTGTAEQWNQITIEGGNTPLTTATINYNYTKE